MESRGIVFAPPSNDNLILIFMLDHAGDGLRHFLRNDDGILYELRRRHSQALYNRALEKRQKITGIVVVVLAVAGTL
jgi:hypothetical protein